MKSVTGHCLCGAVQIAAKLKAGEFHACHCAMCLRWSGGPVFATAAEHVDFEGEENIGVFQSSSWAERLAAAGFSIACGNPDVLT